MNSDKGFDENSKLSPASPYGCAKIYSYWMTRVYRHSYKLFASNGLLFNHESPRRGETFVSRKITLWFAKYWKNLQNNIKTSPLLLGNLNSFRDWSHSKDCVYAQWLILQHNKPDDFVISSGETHSIREFVETCFMIKNKKIEWIGIGLEEVGICDGEIVVKIDPKYFRPMEVDYLLGDCEKAKKELNWLPTYTFEQLVKEMVESDIKGN